jgi:osomolarity two-component system, response regulator SKN7
MSGGRQNVGGSGGWMHQQAAGGSSHSSPASSVKSNSYGEYGNPVNAAYHQQQQQQAIAGNARYNPSIMQNNGNPYAQPQQQQPHMQFPQQQQQQQQQQPPQQQYGTAQNPNFYQQYGQSYPPNQSQPQQMVQHQQNQRHPHVLNQANVSPYGVQNGQLPPTGMGAPADMNYGGGSWVSTVPSSFTSQDGSAITKSQHTTRDNGPIPHAGAYGQMNQIPGMPPFQQTQQGQFPVGNVNLSKLDQGEDGEEEHEENEDGELAKKSRMQQKGASEFVKKLFRMLDDTSYSTIVSWSPNGDSFIVRDMNDFTKYVLPRHFRHSNFASFVRQLNKYDFHKVKKEGGEGQTVTLGVDQQWEFRHPAFLKGREDLLDHVKRKAPPAKKGRKDEDGSPRDGSPSMPGVADAAEKGAQDYAQLKDQVATLTASQDQMTSHINNLTKQYQAVIGEMLTFQKNMVQQDQLMQNLIQYLMNLEADRKIDASTAAPQVAGPSRPQLENGGAFVSTADAEKLVSSFSDVAKESFSQMSQIAQRAAMGGSVAPSSVTSTGTAGDASTTNTSLPRRLSEDEALSPKSSLATPANLPAQSPSIDKGKAPGFEEYNKDSSIFLHPPHFEADDPSNDLFSAAANAINNPSLAGFEDAGLRVFTVGTLQPRSESADANPEAFQSALARDPPSGKQSENDDRPFGISVPNLEQLPSKMPRVDGRATSANPTPKPGGEDGNEPSTPSEGGSNLLRIRRSTYVPGWAVPPKVLVVDDDDVCRKLGSKFLQVFGCAIDVAVDGVTAVNKMNLEKYDLVLMDIVMPNLDGVSATSLIREFDARTPIISMTSNSGPQELLSYMSSGMNDVLPKPFTKEGLLNMLEKHLIHLKTVQKMDEIPKALGLPPISGDVMQNVLAATAASAQSMGSAAPIMTPGDGANPMAAMMGNGPEALRASQDLGSGSGNPNSINGNGVDENGEPLVNPLAGMGFSDEEYISMLQNLIAAGAVSDTNRGEMADSVANVMGVSRGEGSMAATMPRSKESTPVNAPRGSMLPPSQGITRKRSIDSSVEASEMKRSRFTEMP